MSDWKVVGVTSDDGEVATLLNNEGIGAQAAVAIEASSQDFVVWGNDDNSTNLAGFVWRLLGTSADNDGVQQLLQSSAASGAAVSVNASDEYVVWGYLRS